MTLLELHSEEYEPLAAVTTPPKREYCERWGLEFVERRHWTPVTCWQRPKVWLDELQKTDWLFFLGTDATITNLKIDVRKFCEADFTFAADGNGMNNDVFVMRNCAACVDFLEKVCAMEGRIEHEQAAMNVVLSRSRDYAEYASKVGNLRIGGEPVTPTLLRHLERELNRSEVRCRIVSQRELNGYPHKFYGGTGEEAHSWQPGDFIAHLPGHTMRTRVKGFSEIEIVR